METTKNERLNFLKGLIYNGKPSRNFKKIVYSNLKRHDKNNTIKTVRTVLKDAEILKHSGRTLNNIEIDLLNLIVYRCKRHHAQQQQNKFNNLFLELKNNGYLIGLNYSFFNSLFRNYEIEINESYKRKISYLVCRSKILKLSSNPKNFTFKINKNGLNLKHSKSSIKDFNISGVV